MRPIKTQQASHSAFFLILALWGNLHSAFSAEPPTLEHLFPVGILRGATNTITLTGKFDPWPPKAWAGAPGLAFNAQTNKGKFDVTVSAEAPVGPLLVRLHNEAGASEPRFLVVTEKPDLLDVEPNDQFAKPQLIEQIPITINGKLDKSGDVDSFAVTLQPGQTLRAKLDAYILASKMDALLRLVTTNGIQRAWNHDHATLDPQLSWTAPEAGLFVVQVMGFKFPADADVRLTGGDGCVYRLHLSIEDPTLSAAPAKPEIEPNNSLTNAQPAELPILFAGAISPAGDQDRFLFEANKDETVEVRVAAAPLGSPLDAWLKIEEPSGKELARADDSDGSRDPQLEWKAPAPGKFVLVVGSLLRNPGTNACYQLSARRLSPDFNASLSASSFNLTAGSTNEIKITVNRLRGFDHKLSVEARGLPEGVQLDPVEVPEKGGELILKLRATDAAQAASQPIQFVVRDLTAQTDRPLSTKLTGTTTNNGVPGGYTDLLIDSMDQLWLTVLKKP